MAYSGQLNRNEVILGKDVAGALYNQIISINTEASNIAGVYGKLLEAMKTDGGMYGDTKLIVETDCLESAEWGMDAEAGNLLEVKRPKKPNTEAFVIDQFRQVGVTLDDYMTKRAFADEGSFSSFNSVIRGWVGDTKKVYDATTFNAAIGTMKSEKAAQNLSVTVGTGETKGQVIAEELADLLVKLGDVSRDYNDLEFLRSYAEKDIIVVWNASYVNYVKKVDLPTLFHKEGLIDKFEDYVLPARYFGDVITSGTADGKTIRSLVEQTIGGKHIFAGDLIPSGVAITADSHAYKENSKVICKVMAKGSVPFMSSFSVGTSFFNPKSLTENQYLTWSHNTLDYRKGKPYITIVEA